MPAWRDETQPARAGLLHAHLGADDARSQLPTGKHYVSVKDKQGNFSRIERTFSAAGVKR